MWSHFCNYVYNIFPFISLRHGSIGNNEGEIFALVHFIIKLKFSFAQSTDLFQSGIRFWVGVVVIVIIFLIMWRSDVITIS